MPPDLQALSFQTGSIFTPGAPINEKDLFAGRSEQVEKIIDAVSQHGCHAILYGERGVGKTSLSNMISAFLANRLSFVISRTNCDISEIAIRHYGPRRSRTSRRRNVNPNSDLPAGKRFRSRPPPMRP